MDSARAPVIIITGFDDALARARALRDACPSALVDRVANRDHVCDCEAADASPASSEPTQEIV